MPDNENIGTIRFDFKDEKEFYHFCHWLESNSLVYGVGGMVVTDGEGYYSIKLVIKKEYEQEIVDYVGANYDSAKQIDINEWDY